MSLKTRLRDAYIFGKARESKDSNTMDEEKMGECGKDLPNQPPSLGIPDSTIEEISSDFPSTETYESNHNEDRISSGSNSPLLFRPPSTQQEENETIRKVHEFKISSYAKRENARDTESASKDRWGVISFGTKSEKKKRRRKHNKFSFLNHTGNMYTRRLEVKYMRLMEKHIRLLEEKLENTKIGEK